MAHRETFSDVGTTSLSSLDTTALPPKGVEKHTETPESLLNGIIAYLRSPEFAAVTKEYYDENNIKVTPDLKEITFQEWNGYRLELNGYKIRVGDLWLGRSDRSDIEKLKVDITNLEIKIKEFIAKLRGINQGR